jgi:hypothetical protein
MKISDTPFWAKIEAVFASWKVFSSIDIDSSAGESEKRI